MLIDIPTEEYVTDKILLIDIETSPNLAYVWGKYKQNVIQYEQEWHILSFAVKWLGDKKTYVYGLDDFKKHTGNDEMLVRKIWEYLDEAEIVVGHNCDRFDLKKINSRFLLYHIEPPEPYKTIDTLKVARKYFNFNSNKLGDLGKTLRVGSKQDSGGFETWLGCMNNDKESWKKLKKYNKQDVVLLETIYMKMRKWITNHPRVGMVAGLACPVCGGVKLQRRGYAKTATSKKQRYQCSSCGAWHSATIKHY